MNTDTHAGVKGVAIIGAGPAGLMAAEQLLHSGLRVDVYDAMPSAARKFLMAGKGGLNISHAEPLGQFVTRYGDRRQQVEPWLHTFSPTDLRNWAQGLGIATFVGSSGRVFPDQMKAAPLLRAWLHRLREGGVHFHMRHYWQDFKQGDGGYDLQFTTAEGERVVHADAVVLALGGGSWARLGADGKWVPVLRGHGVAVAPLQPSNCGFEVAWSGVMREHHAGAPVKNVAGAVETAAGRIALRGEFNITGYGVEGGLIYALSKYLREAIHTEGRAILLLDLLPDHSLERVRKEIGRPRGDISMANHLRRRLGLTGVKAALLRECVGKEVYADTDALAAAIKALPLEVVAPRPLDEAISSAGGVGFEAVDAWLMLRDAPGLFCAGEMLDWEAPTGGYLLSACLASGVVAGRGVRRWLDGLTT